jgi:hypothetical protein
LFSAKIMKNIDLLAILIEKRKKLPKERGNC